jgi:tetratricopeptide (TPR) repeat protein
MFLWKGNLGAALESAAADSAAHPDNLEEQELYVDVLLSLGLSDRAAEVFRARVALHPDDPDAHYLLGRALVDPAASRAEYERALRIDPDHARSHMGVAAVYVAQGKDDDAFAAYSRATALDPTLAEAWVGLARIQIARNDLAGALATTRQALARIKDESALYFLAAGLEPARAREWMQQAVASCGGDPSVHSGLAEVLLEAGDPDAAGAEAIAALAINPSLADAQKMLVMSAEVARKRLDLVGYHDLVAAHDSESGDPKKSLAALDALVKRFPQAGIVLLARSQLHLAMGDRPAAGADLQAALAVEGDLMDVQQAWGLYELGEGQVETAKPYLERAYDVRPWDPALALALGQVYRKTADHPAAQRVLAEAWAAHPWDADVAIAYAQAQLDAGDAEGAYRTIREAAQRIPDPKLGVAFVTSATAAGHFGEAATILENLGKQTGRQTLLDEAAQLRARAEAQR